MALAENIEQLHRELADYIRAKDDGGVRAVYRELLRAGLSRQEIVGEVIHLANAWHDADNNTLGSPDLIGSARLQDEVEPNTAEQTRQFVYCAAPVLPSATDVDPPMIGASAEKVSDNTLTDVDRQVDCPGGHVHAPQWMGLRALIFAIAILGVGSVSGLLFLHATEEKRSPATAPIAPPTAQEGLASEIVGRLQAPAQASSLATYKGAPDESAANAAPAPASPPHGILADDPFTPQPGTALIVAAPDPAAIPREAPLSPIYPRASRKSPQSGVSKETTSEPMTTNGAGAPNAEPAPPSAAGAAPSEENVSVSTAVIPPPLPPAPFANSAPQRPQRPATARSQPENARAPASNVKRQTRAAPSKQYARRYYVPYQARWYYQYRVPAVPASGWGGGQYGPAPYSTSGP